MAYEFKLPDLGEGDPLVEIQPDKTTVEIPSPAAGKVAKILASEGDVVPVGTVIVVIGDGAGAGDAELQAPIRPVPTAPERTPVRRHGEKVRATPLVRR